MISRNKVLELIERGECLNVEFKQRFSSHEKIAKEMIAFANTRGGFILIGVDDDKSLFGIGSEKSDVELVKESSK
jgi:predicted HTH transcriptional regulator